MIMNKMNFDLIVNIPSDMKYKGENDINLPVSFKELQPCINGDERLIDAKKCMFKLRDFYLQRLRDSANGFNTCSCDGDHPSYGRFGHFGELFYTLNVPLEFSILDGKDTFSAPLLLFVLLLL